MSQVSDYDIANASGAAVRSDINLVFDAVKTLNSGSSDPTNAVAFMLYGDTSDNILKIRNSANSSFTEIGNINQANLGLLPKDGTTAMSGGLQLIAGAENSLSLKFSTDSDTGLFRQGSNVLGIVAGGTERVRVDGGGLKVRNGHALQLWSASNNHRIQFSFLGNAVGQSNLNFTLPTADGANGSVLQTDGSGALSFVAIQGVPTGTIFCFAIATVPTGYLECNGQSTSGHAALAALIGSNVPDLRGEFVRGWASNRAVDSGRQIGSTQGEEFKSHTHTASGTADNHRHNYAFAQGSNGGVGSDFGGSGIASVTQSGGRLAELEQSGGNDGQDLRGYTAHTGGTTNSGGTVPLTVTNSTAGGAETRPRNVALMYIIKT